MELLPKEAIAGMFIKDIEGYTKFAEGDFYPRPPVYLASYKAEEDKFCLVMANANEIGTHKSHETASCHDIAAIWVAFFSRRQRYRC